jgi:hypothetical protein
LFLRFGSQVITKGQPSFEEKEKLYQQSSIHQHKEEMWRGEIPLNDREQIRF